ATIATDNIPVANNFVVFFIISPLIFWFFKSLNLFLIHLKLVLYYINSILCKSFFIIAQKITNCKLFVIFYGMVFKFYRGEILIIFDSFRIFEQIKDFII
ncbi:hypothetical protein BM531_20690, partial [Clostridioides difficile]